MNKSSPTNRWSHRLCIVLTAGAALLGAVTNGQAQTGSYTNTFDIAGLNASNTGGSVASYIYWYGLGYGNTPMTNDPTMDANGNASSGSLQVFLPFGASGDQGVFFGTFHNQYGYDSTTIYDGTKFDTISFDIRVQPGAITNSAGNFGQIQVGFVKQGTPGGGTFYGNSPTIPGNATNQWVHIVQQVDTAAAGTAVIGFNFKYVSYSGYPTSPITFWIDNLVAHFATVVTPPPKLSSVINDAIPGLNLYLNNQYDRTSLQLQQTTGVGWLGQPDTTYSFRITQFPDGRIYTNNQAHIFVATPPGGSAIDYSSPNVVWLNVQGNTDGTGTGYFRYKINEPNANTNMFGGEYTVGPLGTPWAGQLAALNAATPVGTWSMTFNQDTNVTLTGPGGVTTSFTIRPEVAAQFADPLNVLFGAQPNNAPPATGQIVILSHASITNSGAGSPVDDDFIADNGFLNTALWAISAADASDVQLFPTDPGQKLVKWTLPDTYFGLQAATNLTGSWTVLSGTDAGSPISTFTIGGSEIGLVPSANLGPNQNFFRMSARKFTKLQMLMPGETADPGSVTGKTGAPNDQNTNVSFTVTVNAVDANWFPAPYASDHAIHITSNDGTATLPANAFLTAGTATFNVTNNAVGSWTFTASDVTDPTKTANTGSPVNVNP
jgi:hypothetical protein